MSTAKHILLFIVYYLLFCTLKHNLTAQTTSTFMRTFNAAGMNGGLSLTPTTDGGFIGTGQHGTSGAGSCDVYVYKVDACGEPEWYKLYGGTGEDGGYAVEQTSDGGYVIAGLSYLGAGAYDMLLLKINSAGGFQWAKVIGGADNDYGIRAKEVSDGGFIMSGFTTGLGFGAEDVTLVKTDVSGTILWKKIYGGAGSDWGNYIEQTPDGGYIITGYTTSFGAGGFDIYLLRVDSNGALLWSKTYGGAGSEGSSQWGISAKLLNNGIMLCANSNSWGAGDNDFLLIKTDLQGNLLWAKTYGGVSDDQPRFAEPTPDGGFILSGYTTSFGAGSLDSYLIKTDSAGNMLWSKAYGGAGSDRGCMARHTPDGGYAMSTITSSFGADYFDALFIKTDSAGFVGCNEANAATIVNNVIPLVDSGGNEMVLNAATATPALQFNNYVPVDEFICKHCITVPTFVPSDTNICIGDTVYFYNTTSIGVRCFENWHINGAEVNGNKDTLPFVFNTSGTQTIQLISSCNSATDTSTITIHVFDYPHAAFSHTTVCEGNPTVFTNNSTIASGSIASWNWDFGDGSPINTNQTISGGHTYSNAGTYNTSLIVSNSIGCSDTVSNPIQIYFNPEASFIAADVCLHDTAHFVNTSAIDSSSSITNYVWVFNDGSPNSNIQNPTHYFSSSGTYNVTLITTSVNGCSNGTSGTIKIFDAPVPHFTFNDVCLTDSAYFINTSNNPSMGSISHWQWNFGDGSNWDSISLSPHHIYSAPGAYETTLIVYSSNLNCSDTLNDSITVFPMPIAAFSSNEVCLNDTTFFTDLSTVATGTIINSWSWNFNDGTATSIEQNTNHIFANYGTHLVHLSVLTNNMCSDSISNFAIIHPLPAALFSSANVCEGDSTAFYNLSSTPAPDSIVLFEWNFGDNTANANSKDVTHLYNTPGANTVWLKVISNFGCVDSSSKISIVNPNPFVDFEGNDTIGCEPLCITFTDYSTIVSGGLSQWLWNFGDGSPNSTSQNIEHCYTSDSIINPYILTVNLMVTSDSGCTTSGNKQNYITVYPLPEADFSVHPSSETILNPVISIINSSIGANSWSWDFGDDSTSAHMNPYEHSYHDTGTFIIRLIINTQYNCPDTTFETVVIEPDFAFFAPNSFTPNDDGINDSFMGKGVSINSLEMRIFDRWGNLIFYTDDKNKAWDGKANYGKTVAQPDVYIYQISLTDFKDKKHNYRGTVTLVR